MGFGKFFILNVRIDAVTLEEAVSRVLSWTQESGPRMVFFREIASLALVAESSELRELHDIADMVTPDGAPLAWIGRFLGYGRHVERVCGADLLEATCKASEATGKTHYFYGGQPGVAEEMKRQLLIRYPNLKIVGTMCPPMRDITRGLNLSEAQLEEINVIKAKAPDFIWVGISSPKQEYWISAAAPLVGAGVFFGVGAGFNFISGKVPRAPAWMRNIGLEWLHRLLSEPRRLWRRYLLIGPSLLLRILWKWAQGAQPMRRVLPHSKS